MRKKLANNVLLYAMVLHIEQRRQMCPISVIGGDNDCG